MSLVDYASSSDDEQVKEDPVREDKRQRSGPTAGSSSAPPPSNAPPLAPSRITVRTSGKLGGSPTYRREAFSAPSAEVKLPDASLLLNSPAMPSNLLNASDHSSRVAAAMAESAARKRDLNGSSSTYPRSKIPKGALPHSKSYPDTVDGRLLPPQLTGRSNVVTEDISKLFVRKQPTNSPME